MSGVSRRTLLKGGIAGLSSVVLGPDFFRQCLGLEAVRGGDHVSLYTGRITAGFPTTCGLCPAGCGVLAFLDEGQWIGLAGNPDHPYNRGVLCAFGSAGASLVGGPCRIRKPLRRQGPRGGGRWEEISWEEAMRTLTKALGHPGPRREPSDGGLAVCVPGSEVSPFVKRFLAFFRHGVLAVADGHEHGVETAAHRSFGPAFDARVDLARSDRILNFGANPLGSIRRLVGTARQWAEGKERGVRWITLDPRLSETAAASDEWIPLRPGTDGPFALALAHQILKNRWENRSFLEAATDVDRDTLWEALAPWMPERAGALCEVPADRIRSVAERFAAAGRPVAIYGSGVTGRRGGLATAQAILLLNLLVGNIGREGGSRGTDRKEAWRQPDPLPPGKEGEFPVLMGTLFWDLQRGKRRIGCLLSHRANPAVTDPDAVQTARVLLDERRVPFHVALASRWNETSRLADLVLPASTFLESWGLLRSSAAVSGPSAWVSLRQPVVSRPEADSRSLDELLLDLARVRGGEWREAFPFEGVEAYYRRLLECNVSAGPSSDVFRETRKQGFVRVPAGAEKGEGKHGLRDVVSQCLPAIAASSDEMARSRRASGEKTLILYASPTRGGVEPPFEWVDEIDHADPLWIHPKAADRLGLSDGDRVSVKGPAGSLETRVRLTEGIHPEAVAMAATAVDREEKSPCPDERHKGKRSRKQGRWWDGESYGGNARRVIPWPEDPYRESPGWMDTVVTVTRLQQEAKG